MKSNCVIVSTTGTSRGGKHARMRVYDLELLVDGELNSLLDRRVQFATMNGMLSCPMCELSLEDFESIFDAGDIEEMRLNGVLDYYPDGKVHLTNYVYTDSANKYPVFSAKIYKKYGIALDIRGELLEER